MEIDFAKIVITEEHKSLMHRKLVKVVLELLLKLSMVVKITEQFLVY